MLKRHFGAGAARPAHVAALAAVVVAVLLLAVLLLAPSAALAADPLTPSVDQSFTVRAADTGNAPAVPRITAKGAILVDMATGTVLYSRNADTQLEMASTTKMMTAILILESMSLDQQVKVPAAAASMTGSVLGLKKGESFTVEQLLYMMLVPSANDAACTLAIAQAGSVSAFVTEMNDRAQKMGLANTHFVNAWGLHAEGHYSSASDLSKIASAAMQNATFRKIVSTREYTVPLAGGITNRVIKTSNELLRDYDWVNGIKTGSTPWAGYCLVSSATKDGLTLVSVVLGAKDENTRELESKSLLEYGFARCEKQDLVDEGVAVVDIPLADPLGREVRLVTGSAYSRRLLGEDEVTGSVKLGNDITTPVKAGDTLGELDFTQDGASLGSVKLVAAVSVGAPTLKLIMASWSGAWMNGLALSQFLAPAGGAGGTSGA